MNGELLHIGKPNEDTYEQATIQRLEALGYEHVKGGELREDEEAFPFIEVIHRPTLRTWLLSRYPHLEGEGIEAAISKVTSPDGADLTKRNLSFHVALTRGVEILYKRGDGTEAHEHVYFCDFQNADNNLFWAVNQLPIKGNNDRRPDIIIYVNGLPLVVFELKSPFKEKTTVQNAHNQLQHYLKDIPQLFEPNAFCVIADGTEALHGMMESPMEWYAPWKSIDGHTMEKQSTGSMKTLIEGLFPKNRLLEYIRSFIVHEVTHEKIIKKGAKYHQFFGVRFAVTQAIRATSPDGDRKIGVIWHTQGSGKSLSMVFFSGILRQRLDNPTIIVQVDRNDLDEQLYDAFVAAKSLVGTVQHAESVDELRTLLQTQGGEVIFTTIEKFRLREEELDHPVLSDRKNIIVIADEAHRTQYGLSARIATKAISREVYAAYGFAYYLRQAVPSASFIGFTGTPVDLEDRDTVSVFGNIIHSYDITQAQSDGAIVPIYYEPRQIGLRLVNEKIDEELSEITEGSETNRERAKWAALEAAAGARPRLERLAADIVQHYETRTKALEGKAMIVCMSRRICVALYDEIIALRPAWKGVAHDEGVVKVVMTGNISTDPPGWNDGGHITTKDGRETIKARFRDPTNPLRLVLVRDMWLTGTDIPCMHTLYVDKPMRGHSLMQAIARVNRVFEDKPGGLIVDYIGIGTELNEAARKYTSGGFGEPTAELDEEGLRIFLAALEAANESLPDNVNIGGWRSFSAMEFEDLLSKLYGHYVRSDEKRDEYLKLVARLNTSYALVAHLDDVKEFGSQVALHQYVRIQIVKTNVDPGASANVEGAVRQLVDRSILDEGVVDIYAAAGIERPDISVLDESFLKRFREPKSETDPLRVRLLEKLMKDEIKGRLRKNVARYSSFYELLEKTLNKYHTGVLTAAEVIKVMVELRQEMEEEDVRKEELGLSDEELAFYDAISGLGDEVYDLPFVKDLVHDVLDAVKKNLRIDWTKPHRDSVKASVAASVKRVLRRRGVKREHFQFILTRVMEQAEARFADWPMVG